jgi:hypothetical protein
MGVHNFDELKAHVGHKIVCVTYNDGNDPVNVALECEDCHTVLLDFDKFDDDLDDGSYEEEE